MGAGREGRNRGNKEGKKDQIKREREKEGK